MKSKITIAILGLAALSHSATSVFSQQVYFVGDNPPGQMAAPTQPLANPYPGQPSVAQPVSPQIQVPAVSPGPGSVLPVQAVGEPATPSILSRPVAAPVEDAGAAPTTAAAADHDSSGDPACDDGDTCDGPGSCDGCDSPGCASHGKIGALSGLSSLFNGQLNNPCNDLWGGACVTGVHGLGCLHDSGAPRPSRFWFDGELMWLWSKNNRSLPVLATTSTPGTPFDEAGVLGLPTTQTLFGGGEVGDDADLGWRAMAGLWFNPEQTWGAGIRGFYFGPQGANFSAQSDGSPILARPFFNAGTSAEDALVVTYPGVSSGSLDIDAETEVSSIEIFLRKMLYYGYGNRIDVIGGFHASRIEDSVRINDVLVSENPGGILPIGTRIETDDIFRASNDFYGGEVGLMTSGFDGRLTWNLITKVSFGSTRERVSINGQTQTTIPGGGSSLEDFGLLALPSNIGVYENDEFTILPELAVNVAYSVTSRLQFSVGYSLLYWSNAAMASNAVDTTINPTQTSVPVGPIVPVYSLTDDSFWLQGITGGINLRF